MFPGTTTMAAKRPLKELRGLGRQAGFGTMVLALMVLTGLTIVTFYAAHTGLTKQRIVANEIRTREALEAAEAGIERAMQYLNANRRLIASASNVTVSGTSYSGWSMPSSERWAWCGPQSTTFPCSVIRDLEGADAMSDLAARDQPGAFAHQYLVYNSAVGSSTLGMLPGTDEDGPVSRLPSAFANPQTGDAPAEVYVLARCTNEEGEDENCDCADTSPMDGACDTGSVSTTRVPQLGEGSAFIIVSTGYSADQTGQATVSQAVSLFPVYANPPVAPLIAATAIDLSGNIELVANPNGGGEGVALSVWSNEDLDIEGGSADTCQLDEYLFSGDAYLEDGISKCNASGAGSCSCSGAGETGILSSSSTGENNDVLDSDPGFPDDLFAYVFGIERADWLEVKQDATEVVPDCSGLNGDSYGLIWVTGNCHPPAGEIGSVDNPVLLLIDDHELVVNSNTEFYGLVFLFDKNDDGAGADMTVNGTAQVYGAVIAEAASNTNGTFVARYEETVLRNLVNSDNSNAVARIPASWRELSDL
jgi:hypothetical protein